jgi:Spy/CpxP family protein refolding chaperone
MKFNKTMILSALAAIGLLSGVSLQAQDNNTNAPAGAPPAGQRGGGNRGAMTIDTLKKQLDLSDDQVAKVKPILEDMQKQMQALRADTTLAPTDRRAKMKEIRDGEAAKLKEVLTADQYAKWEKSRPTGRAGGGAGGAPATPPPAGDTAPKN